MQENDMTNMIYSSGTLSLNPLIKFAESDPAGQGIWVQNKEGKEFSRLITELLDDKQKYPLTNKSGVYVWVKKSSDHTVEYLYVGQSHNLRRRLYEELTKERIAFWPSISKEKIDAEGKIKYADKWGQYKVGLDRTMKKQGVTHIIWLESADLAHVRLQLIESRLISEYKTYKKGNTHKSGDSSKARLGKDAEKFIELWKKEIKSTIDKAADSISLTK